MREFLLPSRRKNWAVSSVPSCCRADRRYTTCPGVASGPTAARYGLGTMVHCRAAWLARVRANLHRYHSSPARTDNWLYSAGRTRRPERGPGRVSLHLQRQMLEEGRGKRGGSTKTKQQHFWRITAGSPHSPSQKYTQAAAFAPASLAAALFLLLSCWL